MVCFAAGTPDTAHWAWTVAGLLAVPALVALNGFFVAAEFALVAVRKTRVEELVNQGTRGATAVRDAVAHLDRTIAATQLGITWPASPSGGSASRPSRGWSNRSWRPCRPPSGRPRRHTPWHSSPPLG